MRYAVIWYAVTSPSQATRLRGILLRRSAFKHRRIQNILGSHCLSINSKNLYLLEGCKGEEEQVQCFFLLRATTLNKGVTVRRSVGWPPVGS